jgi:hypothetical protein
MQKICFNLSIYIFFLLSISHSFTDSNEKSYSFPVTKSEGKLSKSFLDIRSQSFILLNIKPNKDLKQVHSSYTLKFKVTAFGYYEDFNIQKTHLKDTCENLSSLLGAHFSRVYQQRNIELTSINTSNQNSDLPCSSNSCSEDQNQNTPFMLCGYQHQMSLDSTMNRFVDSISRKDSLLKDFNSLFYRVLFRGGHFSSSNKDSFKDFVLKCLDYLSELSTLSDRNDLDELTTKLDEKFKSQREFFFLYDKNFESSKKLFMDSKVKIGGLGVTALFLKLFCVLMWHNPCLNETFLAGKNEFLTKLFKLSVSCRSFIVEQQQIFKNDPKNATINPSYQTILSTRINYLLKFDRTPDELVKFELWYREGMREKQLHHYSKLFDQNNNLKNLPKSDLYPTYNLIFEFLFDEKILNYSTDFVDEVLSHKKNNTQLIIDNFKLAINHFENLHKEDNDAKKCENILLLLTSFFSENNYKNKKIKSNFPPVLALKLNHYLDDLYSCGLSLESELRKVYFDFIKILMKFNECFDLNEQNNKELVVSFHTYLTCFFDLEWNFYDLEAINDLNLIDYLIQNCVRFNPVFLCENRSEILKNMFDFSREKYDKLVKLNSKNNRNENDKNDTKPKDSYKLIAFDEDDEGQDKEEEPEACDKFLNENVNNETFDKNREIKPVDSSSEIKGKIINFSFYNFFN